METADFVRHVKEVLVWNDMQDALTHAQFEALTDSFARAMKHAYEYGATGMDEYYSQQRPAGPKMGDNVR